MAHTFLNTDLSEAGQGRGTAANWAVSTVSSAAQLAGWDDTTIQAPLEDYEEGWNPVSTLLTKEAPYFLENNDSLVLSVDGGSNQVLFFSSGDFTNIAAATAFEVSLVFLAGFTGLVAENLGSRLRLTSLSGGTVEVLGGTAVDKLGLVQFWSEYTDDLDLLTSFWDNAPSSIHADDYETKHGPYDGTDANYGIKVNPAHSHLANNANVGLLDDLVEIVTTPAFFDGIGGLEAFEDYEEGHGPYDGSNSNYREKVDPTFGFPANQTWSSSFTGTTPFSTSGTTFDGEAFEDYEESWGGDYQDEFVGVGTDLAVSGWVEGAIGYPYERYEGFTTHSHRIQVSTAFAGVEYIVNIDGIVNAYLVGVGDTPTDVKSELAGVINNNNSNPVSATIDLGRLVLIPKTPPGGKAIDVALTSPSPGYMTFDGPDLTTSWGGILAI